MHAVRPSNEPGRPSSAVGSPISDLDAIDEVLRGNREMFEVIVRRYNSQLYRVGMAYLRNHARVEDAMQDAYIKAYLHLGRFQRTAAFSTWLTRIMINECLMVLRRAKTNASVATEQAIDAARMPVEAVTSDTIQINEMKALLEHAISALPENYRAVYLLREVQQLTVSETADCLGISVESVKVLLHRARTRLKSNLLHSAAGVEAFSYPAQFCTPMTERVLAIVLKTATPTA